MKATMTPISRWWAPSLVRRVVLALLLAFALVWAALVTQGFVSFKQSINHREQLQRSALALAASLDFADEVRAVLVMQGTELQYNHLRHSAAQIQLDDLLFQLARPDGSLVFASKALTGQTLTPAQADQTTWLVGGRKHWLVTHTTQHWRITILEPALTDMYALRLISQGLVQSMLIAFPLVLLPLWLAVRRGLLPLRELVQRVAARPPADFSPLTLDLHYAELRPLEAAFNDLLRQARTGIQSERGFVQDAAHELRTPLAVMAAQAHALTSASDPQQQQQARVELERAIERASHLVHQLLTLARLEAHPPPSTQTVDLVELIQGVLIRVQAQAQARAIDLGLESPETLVATVDTQVLLSALENLVNNALAYVHEGARVTVSLTRTDAEFCLCVADDGPGIAIEDRPRVMERFQRGRDTRSSGSGLGLAIVAQAAAQLGGELQIVEGLDERGIGFLVRWPSRSP
jgi:two-component system sensor histidine kinase QseC